MKNKIVHLLSCLLTMQTLLAEPMWIWKEGKIKTEKAQFKKTFTLDSVPKKASLTATCENEFMLMVNGKKVKNSSKWDAPVKTDIAKYLVKGKNTIGVRAFNESSMA